MQYIQLRRPCAIDIAVENNIGQSGPGSNGHQAIGGLARFQIHPTTEFTWESTMTTGLALDKYILKCVSR